jgi:hypothetical protein
VEHVRALAAICVLVLLAAGCATDTTSAPGGTSPASATAAPVPASSTATGSATAATPPSTTTTSESGAPPAGAVPCSPDPMAHVYNPERLHVLDPCVTLAGSVSLVRAEADGDYHVRLILDAGQQCAGMDCLDAGNRAEQGGGLVVELVCAHDVTQADAVSACIGYHTLLPVPSVGEHLTVTGPWVFDADHGWNEIHPAESFGGAPPPASAPAPSAPAQPPPAALAVTITASQYGYVAASTAPGATCSATAELPSGRTSTAAGLQAHPTAGTDGTVSWTYGTSSSTKHGTGRHTVTCSLGGATASASAPFTVG